MSTYVEYAGPFKIGQRVDTPDGPGHVSALYPPTAYYEGRLVQVTFDAATPGPLYDSHTGEYVGHYDWNEGDNARFADTDLTLRSPDG